jgi:hypothetical protein
MRRGCGRHKWALLEVLGLEENHMHDERTVIQARVSLLQSEPLSFSGNAKKN